jgi:hypothetical protein
LPYLTPPISGEFHLCTNQFAIIYRCGFPVAPLADPAAGPAKPEDSISSSRSKATQADWQLQVRAQAEQIKQQQAQIDALKQIVCAMNPAAQICGK